MNYFSQILQRYSTTAAAKPTARLSARPSYNKEKENGESGDEQSLLKSNSKENPILSATDDTAEEIEREEEKITGKSNAEINNRRIRI